MNTLSVIPAKAGIQGTRALSVYPDWIPAFAGMTDGDVEAKLETLLCHLGLTLTRSAVFTTTHFRPDSYFLLPPYGLSTIHNRLCRAKGSDWPPGNPASCVQDATSS
ncbi:MAG: hypothetical protein QG656_946 [Candidatus Hydrogenedentes bacterium]|nr:hypothetical protein [Candidatus Hydrogenedentota bacterium]